MRFKASGVSDDSQRVTQEIAIPGSPRTFLSNIANAADSEHSRINLFSITVCGIRFVNSAFSWPGSRMLNAGFVFAALRFSFSPTCFSPTLTFGQHAYFSNWFACVDKTKDELPHRVAPPSHDNSPPGGGMPLRSTLADEFKRSCHRHLRWRKGVGTDSIGENRSNYTVPPYLD